MQLKTIAYIHNDYKEKFGVPRQSGLTQCLSRIVFEKEYRDQNAVRGLEGFSHIWLIWGFSENPDTGNQFRPTVRPPRLGGDTRMGVFATRSPFRPNPMGLSCVELIEIEEGPEGPELMVKGADLVDGTPIYDIKPYLAQFDSKPEAVTGFVDTNEYRTLSVLIPDSLMALIAEEKRTPLIQALEQDPRPHYQNDPDRVYGMRYADMDVRFRVEGDLLTVTEIITL